MQQAQNFLSTVACTWAEFVCDQKSQYRVKRTRFGGFFYVRLSNDMFMGWRMPISRVVFAEMGQRRGVC